MSTLLDFLACGKRKCVVSAFVASDAPQRAETETPPGSEDADAPFSPALPTKTPRCICCPPRWTYNTPGVVRRPGRATDRSVSPCFSSSLAVVGPPATFPAPAEYSLLDFPSGVQERVHSYLRAKELAVLSCVCRAAATEWISSYAWKQAALRESKATVAASVALVVATEELEAVREEHLTETARHNARLDRIEEAVRIHNERLRANEETVREHNERINERLRANEERLDANDARFAANEERLRANETRVAAQQAEILAQRRLIADLRAKLADIDTGALFSAFRLQTTPSIPTTLPNTDWFSVWDMCVSDLIAQVCGIDGTAHAQLEYYLVSDLIDSVFTLLPLDVSSDLLQEHQLAEDVVATRTVVSSDDSLRESCGDEVVVGGRGAADEVAAGGIGV